LAACTVDLCGAFSDRDSRKECMTTFCNAKLLPSFVFDRALDLAPCMVECAAVCAD
jgi:hypothetical protein